MMKIGITGINVGPMSEPTTMLRVAQLAEELGYESLWAPEHIVLPDLPHGQHRWAADLPIVDPIAALSFLAGSTRTIRLATGVLLLPQHEPRLLAKQLASLDVLCAGRLMVGIGVGNMSIEADAMGISMSDRGKRATEYLEVMLALWSEAQPRYSGLFVKFEGVNAYPRPIQQPGPPIIVGGNSDAALRRAARYGAGWFGVRMDLQDTGHLLERLSRATRHGRPDHMDRLEVTVLPSEPLTPDTVNAYASLGVDRLVVWPPGSDQASLEEFLRAHAPARVAA